NTSTDSHRYFAAFFISTMSISETNAPKALKVSVTSAPLTSHKLWRHPQKVNRAEVRRLHQIERVAPSIAGNNQDKLLQRKLHAMPIIRNLQQITLYLPRKQRI